MKSNQILVSGDISELPESVVIYYKPKNGQKLIFPENDIEYWQDFRFKKGIPSNIEFTVKNKVLGREEYWLEADGYGIIGKSDTSYGNGRICVSLDNIVDYLI